MTDTVDILAKLLEASERRLKDAEWRAGELSAQLAARRPYQPADCEGFARELGDVARGSRINAIRLHRQFTGLGLKESKDAVERYWPAPLAAGTS
jgi:ribosomal protein L7/L12